ncbi:MAG: metallophosphoesterase, partial [Planctomycetes bacterium]|nr:metallophosphoesterase [Planctomycetota bacterium]
PKEDLLLPKQIADLPKDAEFVVHVGDIKNGSTPCNEAVYKKVSGMLAKSKPPVFFIPGDNEWNDCKDPAQAWTFWDKYFMRFDSRWPHGFRIFRQLEREENFSFVRGNVLFIGINIVGGRVHDADEWKRRHAQDLNWARRNLRLFGETVSCAVVFGHAHPAAKHSDFFGAFAKEAELFEKPILYLHGDGHRWIHDRPFAAKNILRVQVDQGGIAPPVKITITNDPSEPFRFDRRK